MVETLAFPIILQHLIAASVRAFEFSVFVCRLGATSNKLFQHMHKTGHGLRDSVDLRIMVDLRGRGIR
jgi:hypothetical protein